MEDQTVRERPRRGHFNARPETLALLKASGHPINGLGETAQRRPSPFFWHPATHPSLRCFADRRAFKDEPMSGYENAFAPARHHPTLVPIADVPKEGTAQEFTEAVKEFALSHEADDIGITPMDPFYVFEGYTIEEPTVIMLAVGHNYERLKQVPSDETNGEGPRGCRRSVCARHTIFLRTGQLDSLPGIRREGVSWAVGRCAAADSGGRGIRSGRVRETWVHDQPKVRLGRPSGGRDHEYAAGPDVG